MHATQRFSDRAKDYSKYRPRYPKHLLDELTVRIGLSPAWKVADAGSGTGISAELFLQNGNEVFAIEPNDAMRCAAEALLAQRVGFHSVAATAEDTTLPKASVDLVVAAQAFHWFDRDRFRRECLRILKPCGFVALIWNDRLTDTTPFLRDYEVLLQEFGTDYTNVNHRNIADADIATFFAGPHEKIELDNVQSFDFAGLRGRLLSSSYVPAADHPRREPMLDELRRVFDRNAVSGQVEMIYRTITYVGRLG